jgi:hypothetical protein
MHRVRRTGYGLCGHLASLPDGLSYLTTHQSDPQRHSKLSVGPTIIERMFDWFGGMPEGWEPIPDDVWASLPPLVADGLPPGMSAAYADSCDRLVDRAVELGPGSAALGLLTAVPPEALSEQARSRALVELTAMTGYVESVRHELTAVIAGPAPTGGSRDEHFAAHEVAVATRSSVYAADGLIALARDLASVLRASRDAMRRGELTLAQAKVIHGATVMLPAEVAQAVQARVLPRAAGQSTAAFKASVQRAVATLDASFARRAKEARDAVTISHTALHDGTGELCVRGPLEVTTEVHMALTAYSATTRETLGGTVDQRKLAGLRHMAEAYLAGPDIPTHHGRPPTVNVVIELPTLLGLNNHPAEIPGVGPLPADAARCLLAAGAPLRRLVTDPLTGGLLDYGRGTYTVPPALADHLIAQYVHSGAPHSRVDARLSDMEHNLPHDRSGPTDRVNCTPVDRRWHNAKTHGGWRYCKDKAGVLMWTSPTGMTCRVEPHDYRLGP